MADKNVVPIIKIPTEQRKKLEGMAPDMEAAEKALKALERLGIDTTPVKDKLTWAKQARASLLRDFD